MLKKFLKRGASALIALAMVIPTIPAFAEGATTNSDVCVDGTKHDLVYMEARKPTFTENGWYEYEYCTNEECSYSTFVAIPALGEPEINDYEDFLYNLCILEMFANEYVMSNPGTDPLELMIKYIRTGVDRYNSGSWGIMAGYENTDFANFIRRYENLINAETENVDEYCRVTGLKNINPFDLPNGDRVDFGHMFGTMDIAYTNKNSENHADVGGWAGDLVDLITSADADKVSGTVEEMVPVLKESYFLKNPQPSDVFSLSDFYGDLDAYYVLKTVMGREYNLDWETGIGTLAEVIMEYFTEELTVEDRAEYFLKNRLGNVGTREQVRRAVYNAYTGNKVVTTLESTRQFLTSPENINNLRKASCYVFADYICSLAGDYIEIESNPYFSEFDAVYSQLAPGVIHETHYATTADGKQMVYYTATADLSNPNVTVYANYNENDPSKGWKMSRVLDQANAAQSKHGNPDSDEYIENYQVIAAINADGYNMATGEPGGLLVMDGKEWHGINASGFFGITKEGKAVIGTTAEYNSTYKDKLRDGVGAFGVTLVKDGKIAVAQTSDYYSDRASRTAVGITKTGKVVFMVLDGRQEPRSCGGSMQEIAQVMLEAGCYTAVNLDGGGSTTFVSKPEGETELKVTSSPSDGYARSVSTSLMMVSTAPSSTKFDHARLDSDYSYATVGTPVKITPVGLSATGNVVDLPENCTWKVDGATITEDGIFTGNYEDSFVVQLLSGDEIVGQKTMTVVTPDNVYFTRKTMDVVYGSKVDIPVAAVYGGKGVAINESDIALSVSPKAAGKFDGYTFNVAGEGTIKSAVITAALADGTESTLELNLYQQGENTFDFDKATSGDRQFAWDRKVSNALSDDAITYIAENPDEDMVTSYIFAIDMKEIPIPIQLVDLLYMLPGADTDNDGAVDVETSAWKFLLQLAERVSVLTEVRPVLKFDERFDIDYSELEVINEYFKLDKESVKLDEEKNELTVTLRWQDQTAAIKPETANPLCMLKGIKLIPKDGAWGENNKINAIHGGEVSYTVYLRANALHTFASKPENQKIYGLYPFTNTFINANNEEEYEAGGYFEDVYKTFEDHYTLSTVKKNGWVNEDGGFAYYVDGERLTGVKLADGYYYDFGENGINVGQQRYTGLFENGGKTYYAKLGELMKSTWQLVGGDMYHCHADGDAYTVSVSNPVTCVKGGQITYTCKNCSQTHKSAFIFPEGHDWDADFKCRISGCGTKGIDISTAIVDFGTVENPRGKDTVPNYGQMPGGYRPLTFVSFDGKTALTKSNDATLNDDGTMRDLYISWTNDKGIGKAYVHYTGKGNYYGERTLEYTLSPANVTSFKATPGVNSITLTWDKAAGAESYRVYVNGTDKHFAETTQMSYTITGLEPETTYSYSIRAYANRTDGVSGTYRSGASTITTTTKSLPGTLDLLSDIKVLDDKNEIKMITKDSTNYIMLPAHINLEELQLNYVVDNSVVSVNNVTVSGDLGRATAVASSGVVAFDMNKVATKEGNCYKVNIAADTYNSMQIVFMKGSDIPSMFITSDSADKDREYIDSVKGNKATAKMTLVDTAGSDIFNGALTEVKARGNSTFDYYNKKAYQIKLDNKADLIGNGEKIKTWVLLANYSDATMMHDKFMKDLAADMGIKYTADSDWVNLWYDGEYRGVYLVSEKNSVGSTSVDITDMESAYEEANAGYGENVTTKTGTNSYGNTYKYTAGLTDPSDITGGYLIELNHDYIDEVNGFMTTKGKGFNLKSPEWLSENAVKYISEYYQEFEDAVYAQNSNGDYTGYNETTGKYFYEYVDIDSLVKMFVMQEVASNPDGFISSLYFNKDANGIMYVGPIWDQDLTLGTGWSKYISPSVKDYNYLAEALINIPVFKDRLAEFFGNEAVDLIEKAISDEGIINQHYNKLSANAEMNYTLWPYIRVGKPSNTDHIWNNANYDLVVTDMKEWIGTRLGILKERFIPEFDLGDVNCDGSISSDDAVLVLKYAVGYSVDDFNIEFADMNGDGDISSDDAVEILKYAVSH